MRSFLICMALFAGQMKTLQDKPVVHLHPNQDIIPVEFGGDLVILSKGPMVVHLPNLPPALDSRRKRWSIDLKNLGPVAVTIVGKAQFIVQVNVDRTVQIESTGAGYSLVR